MTLLGLMRKNLFRKKVRTALTMVSIVVAFVIFGALSAVQETIQSGGAITQADRLIVTNKINFTLSMPNAYVGRVRGVQGVTRVAYADWFGGYFQEPRNILVAFAADAKPYLDIYPEYVLNPEERAVFLKDRGAIAVGASIAERYGWKIGDRIPLSSNIYAQKNGSKAWDFNIAAIFKGSEPKIDTNFVLFHHDYFDEARSFNRDTVGWLIVQTDDPTQNEKIMSTIDGMFANSSFETETKTEQAFNAAFAAQLGDIGFIVTSVVGAAFVTILLIVGNTMILSVRERRGEIAVLKTIGFASNRIFLLILGESLLLALFGGLLGLGLAWLAISALGSAIPQFPPVVLAPKIALSGFGIMLGLGLATGIIPAVRAMNTNVVTALGRA